jgi:hypothetical protein
LINNFQQIVQIVSNDITAMGSSPSKVKRQECLNVEDVPKCLADLEAILTDPSEILGSKKRSTFDKRQECLNVEDVQKCLEDLEEILSDPSEILGGKKKRSAGSPAAHAGSVIAKRQNAPPYDESNQQAICTAFRGVSVVQR